jgi:hypothetical protein
VEPIVVELFNSQVTVIAAALGGLVITTLAIIRDVGPRRSAPPPGRRAG